MRTFTALTLLTALLAPVSAGAEPMQLPEIGDPAQLALPPQEAEAIGHEMMQRLYRQGALVEDSLIEQYVHDLGYRLLAAAELPASRFTFFVIADPSINAFAMPGGYIGVHTGLIAATRNESELAAVLAHEIAHITQRHLERRLQGAQESALPLTAAVIAAILLGGGGELGQAATASALAAGQQLQLDYSRDHEREADRVGIRILHGANFAPDAMAGFFERLQQQTRLYGGGLPEFLSTHPVNASRIADARARAEQLHTDAGSETLTYTLMKARVLAGQSDDPLHLVRTLREKLEREAATDADRYALALALLRRGDPESARQALQPLLAQDPERIAYIHTAGAIDTARGDLEAAGRRYEKGLQLYPGNPILQMALAENRLARDETSAALHLLHDLTATSHPPIRALRMLARAENAAGNLAASHLAQAQYYEATGRTHAAIDQLQLARESADLDFYYQSRIDAMLETLKSRAKKKME